MAAYSGCGERDGGLRHGERRSRTGMARVGGEVQLAGGRVSGRQAPSSRKWQGSQSSEGATELGFPGPALGKMQSEAARRAGEPSGHGKEAPPQGLGDYDLRTQTDARGPAGQVMRQHLHRQPGGVGGEAARGEMIQPHAVLEVSDGVLDLGVAAVAGDEPDVSECLLRDSDFDAEFATLRQARAIITTARRQGLDSVKLSKLAAAMGHEAEELGVTPPSTDYATVSILLGEARDAGFPHDVIDRIYQAIDPDGYEEELYDQAADLREFDDADGALDGLPRFDGEFSR